MLIKERPHNATLIAPGTEWLLGRTSILGDAPPT